MNVVNVEWLHNQVCLKINTRSIIPLSITVSVCLKCCVTTTVVLVPINYGVREILLSPRLPGLLGNGRSI